VRAAPSGLSAGTAPERAPVPGRAPIPGRALASGGLSAYLARPMITIRYFAGARDLAGCDSEQLELPAPEISQAALIGLLSDRRPRLGGYLERMRLALNGEFALPDAPIHEGDEIDLLPPVAGGADPILAEIREAPLSIDEVMTAVRHPSIGGVALFVGVVRDRAEGKDVARLDYEAHPTLGAIELRRVLARLLETHPEVRIAALHRVGRLAVGELAVVVAAGAPHRAEAFAACREAIDRIKETVPVWKKEWDPEGNANWVNLEPS